MIFAGFNTPLPETDVMMPIGPKMWASNLRIFAERLGWPDGAVEAVEALRAEFPEWVVGYHVDHPGYYGLRREHRHGEPQLYGATPDELRENIRGGRRAELEET